MKVAGILTKDFRLYYEIIKEFRNRELPIISLNFNEPIPSSIGVLITTKKESSKINFSFKVIANLRYINITVIKALLMLNDVFDVQSLVIGIDPGKNSGIALLANERVIEKFTTPYADEIFRYIRDLKRTFMNTKMIIKIGNGDKVHMNMIIKKIASLEVLIEIVDERNTTSRYNISHEDAAITIGYRRGIS